MIRVRIRIALPALLVLGVFPVACHKNARVQSNADVGPMIKDTAGVVALFKDTALVSVFLAEGQTFKLQTPGQRQSLHATLRRERELWQARKPRDYKFLLRVGCFCPGSRGWLLIEVRSSQPLRAWDRAVKLLPSPIGTRSASTACTTISNEQPATTARSRSLSTRVGTFLRTFVPSRCRARTLGRSSRREGCVRSDGYLSAFTKQPNLI